MSNHDPLCRRAKIMELLMEGCTECSLIDRVRADEQEAAAQRLKVVRDAADVALLGTLQTTRDRVIAAIDSATRGKGSA